MHTLIIGQTMSGKTTIARKLAHAQRAATDRPIIVLDINLDPKWEADFMTDDPEHFMRVLKANRSCELIVDESGESIGRYGKHLKPIATRSRQYGHRATFITQCFKDLDKAMRAQCSQIFAFSVDADDAKLLSKLWVDESFNECHLLRQGEYIWKMRFRPAEKRNAFSD